MGQNQTILEKEIEDLPGGADSDINELVEEIARMELAEAFPRLLAHVHRLT